MKKHVWKMMVLCAALLISLSSCKRAKYSVEGVVYNVTGVGVKNATVTAFDADGEEVSSATTDATGAFTVSSLKEGEYEFEISATGYETEKEDVDVADDEEQDFQLKGTANVSGTILDSQTGAGKSGVIVGFAFSNTVDKAADCDLIDTTDFYGQFNIRQAPSGTFRAIIEADSSSTRIIDGVVLSDDETTSFGDVTSVSLPAVGELRIVLTWGEMPHDLDSHLTGPDGMGGRFHIYFSNQSYDTQADLDVDDTYSYGPETTTIHTFNDGVYRYSVFNYSDQSVDGGQGIKDSPARVEVYDHTGLLAAYTPPAFTSGMGETWVVCEITAAGGVTSVAAVGNYVISDYSGNVAK